MNIEFTYATVNDLAWLQEQDMHISKDVLKYKIDASEIIVAQEGNTIIGWLRYGLFWDHTPFMNMLMLTEDRRGSGIGREFVQFWENEMKKKGHDVVMTSTQSDEEAQHFYRKIGYTDSGSFVLPGEPAELILIKQL